MEQQQVKWCGAILICGGEQGSPSVPERSLTEVLTEPISSSASTEESGFTWAEPSSPPQKSFIHQLGAFTIVRILLVSARWVFPEERCLELLHQSSVLACRVKAGQQFTERSNNL